VFTILGLILTCLLIYVMTFSVYSKIRLTDYFRETALIFSITLAIITLFALGLLSIILPVLAVRMLIAIILMYFLYLLFQPDNLLKFNEVCKQDIFAFLTWILLAILATVFSSFQVQNPGSLPDGAYVFKDWNKPVQMQWISGGLPMDNALPYYTGEFLIRHQDVKEDHPIMPGQEIILRTYGLPFSYLAIRSLVFNDRETLEIPRFNYVDIVWPDVRVLYDENRYSLFNGVSFFLIAFFGFSIVYAARRFLTNVNLKLVSLLFATSPFLLQQTYFTWSKNLAAAFAILLFVYRKDLHLILTGSLIFTGYFFHPMFIIYVIGIFIVGILIEKVFYWRYIFQYVCADIAWRIYSSTTGLKNDLIQQNFQLNSDIINQIAARMVSLANYFSFDFLRAFPFNLTYFTRGGTGAAFSLIIFSFIPTIIMLVNPDRKSRSIGQENYRFFLYGIVCLLISAGIYSTPAPLIMFGGQILFISVGIILTHLTVNRYLAVIPILSNIGLLVAWIRIMNITNIHLG